jgi:uncharacterized protein GlcG (DUF336 family)
MSANRARATSMTLAHARAIADRALGHAHANDFPPMSVTVLDTAGEPVVFAREDGSSLLRGRIARAKARGALNMGVGGRSLAARAAAHPAFINSVVALADGDLVPAAGGVLVRDDDNNVIGAASPPRGCALTPERLIQPDPAIPTN